MDKLSMLNAQVARISQSYFLLGLVQVFHSIEETYTKLYSYFTTMSEALHQYFPLIPIFEISTDLFAILNYLIIALMLGSVPSAEKGSQWGYYLMWSWAIIELLNGAFHICTWLFLRHYFPGGVSGPILFAFTNAEASSNFLKSERIKTQQILQPLLNALVRSASGMHYCQLLSPAAAMEWIYIDGLRLKASLSGTTINYGPLGGGLDKIIRLLLRTVLVQTRTKGLLKWV